MTTNTQRMGTVAGKDAANDPKAPSKKGDPSRMKMEHKWQYYRKAHHAGSWYEDDMNQLRSILQQFILDAHKPNNSDATTTKSSTGVLRAMVCPHAGYSYSGPTAAYCYDVLLHEMCRPECNITQIVVLHPSHHEYLRGQCAVSGATALATPLGDLAVDDELRNELLQRSSTRDKRKYSFSIMTQSQDEHEHSGEMQYPFLAHVLQKAQEERVNHGTFEGKENVTVTPIMCGSLNTSDEMAYGTMLADILHRPNVLTIVSTDFCHWGSRFAYQPVATANNTSAAITTDRTNPRQSSSTWTDTPIHEFIELLDRRGMGIIESQQPGAFALYLKETGNTICGRHAIGVWLCAITAAAEPSIPSTSNPPINLHLSSGTEGSTASETLNEDKLPTQMNYCQGLRIQFIKYAQSSKVRSIADSSVSYAAGIATTPFKHTHSV